MFEMTVEGEFCAAHAIRIAGVREPNHGHNWRVVVTVRGRELDADGLLCDFHEVERVLRAVIGPLHNGDLNAHAAFEAVNASAEHVAKHIFDGVAAGLRGRLPAGAWVAGVRVTEAPGCAASYLEERRP
ncbi:MAG: 6-pyruvoyl trahydropterin synthase family protein [Phycisphaerales bacterium]